MTTATDSRQTLTVEEAAQVLGIGRTLAFAMVRSGQLPVIRLGRRVLVSRPALDRMLDSVTVTTTERQSEVTA